MAIKKKKKEYEKLMSSKPNIGYQQTNPLQKTIIIR
jgi:hypothetical protein